MNARIATVSKLGWSVVRRVLIGGVLGSLVLAVLLPVLHYSAPVEHPATEIGRPIIDGSWIKVPVTIVRVKPCADQATVTLRRWYDYPLPIGRRRDVVVIGLFNSNLSLPGTLAAMLWFQLPPSFPRGDVWDYEASVNDDCGSIFDLAPRRPRLNVIPAIAIP